MEKKRFIIRDREAGNPIDEFDDLESAIKLLNEFENDDKINNCYSSDFYEIYDTVLEKIVLL